MTLTSSFRWHGRTPPRAGGWRGEVKRIDALEDREIALWRSITANRREFRSPFFSLEFARAVAAAGARARVCLLFEGEELAGFFPFQFADGFAQSMASGERIGGALNDFCGLVIDPSRHGPIDNCVLLRCARLESFEVSHLEEAQVQLGLRFGARSEGARVTLGDPLEPYWRSVKSAHPSDYETLRRRERKMEREFRSVEFAFAHAAPEEFLDTVVAEKRRQYKRTAAEDGLAEAWKLRCLAEIARGRGSGCVPVLSSLFLDGSWAALHFGLRAGNVLHYWLPVYDPRFSSFSPGLVLLARMIRDAREHGIDEIDFGEGLSRYKVLFATELYPIYRDFWYRTTPRGLAHRAFVSLRWRARAIRKPQKREDPRV